MDDMESKLGAILGNPEMMQKIIALAQTFGQGDNVPKPQSSREETPSPFPQFDPAMLQKLTGMAQGSRIDSNQQLLLKALRPYLHDRRINKLERAMRAARVASMATAFLGTSPAGRCIACTTATYPSPTAVIGATACRIRIRQNRRSHSHVLRRSRRLAQHHRPGRSVILHGRNVNRSAVFYGSFCQKILMPGI